jgi:hypothetical protein
MTKLIEIDANTFLNPTMVVSIDPQGSKCVVTLVTGKPVTGPLDAQTLAKKCMAG